MQSAVAAMSNEVFVQVRVVVFGEEHDESGENGSSLAVEPVEANVMQGNVLQRVR